MGLPVLVLGKPKIDKRPYQFFDEALNEDVFSL